MITKEGKRVETPKYKRDTRTWHCPNCGKEVNIWLEEPSYYYLMCDCGCPVANKNLMEERAL